MIAPIGAPELEWAYDFRNARKRNKARAGHAFPMARLAPVDTVSLSPAALRLIDQADRLAAAAGYLGAAPSETPREGF